MADGSYSFKLRYLCPPHILSSALTDARDVSRYTRAPARSEPPTGVYSILDGAISGQWVSVSKDKLELKWRARSWPEGVLSTVTILLSARGTDGDVTDVEVQHTGIPSADAHGNGEQVAQARGGWQHRIFEGGYTWCQLF